ncbi:putative methyltransferase PMT5 [Gossypium australe]|uniref:Putative methyltransferase PMT5 n=1 Tax=Gossypium australe TaxID=47621 RepID=A0A5B6WPE1_9ROSI|nr:putative methyltransferase PMT5 [Gossypium australe]
MKFILAASECDTQFIHPCHFFTYFIVNSLYRTILAVQLPRNVISTNRSTKSLSLSLTFPNGSSFPFKTLAIYQMGNDSKPSHSNVYDIL